MTHAWGCEHSVKRPYIKNDKAWVSRGCWVLILGVVNPDRPRSSDPLVPAKHLVAFVPSDGLTKRGIGLRFHQETGRVVTNEEEVINVSRAAVQYRLGVTSDKRWKHGIPWAGQLQAVEREDIAIPFPR